MNTPEECAPGSRLMTWLFNPFIYIAGWQSLFLGLIIIIAAGLIGSVGNVHFDGVLDIHTGRETSLWFYFAEGLIDWVSPVIFLLISGLILRGISFRIVDIFGTQALARWPMSLSAAIGILPANRRVTDELMKMIQNPNQIPVLPLSDMVVFGATTIIIILTTVWMVVLMYRAYAISCNLKGARAIVSFIICLIIAEIISKIGFHMMVKFAPLN